MPSLFDDIYNEANPLVYKFAIRPCVSKSLAELWYTQRPFFSKEGAYGLR